MHSLAPAFFTVIASFVITDTFVTTSSRVFDRTVALVITRATGTHAGLALIRPAYATCATRIATFGDSVPCGRSSSRPALVSAFTSACAYGQRLQRSCGIFPPGSPIYVCLFALLPI
jgi:hypothetical protein